MSDFKIVKLLDPITLNLEGPSFTGEYSNVTAYTTGESVSYNGSSYVALVNTTGNIPTNTAYWQVLAEKGDTGSGVPTGGTANQALTKVDGTNYNTQWSTIDKTFVGLGNVPNVDATNPSNITQDSTHRFATDAEKTSWNDKVDDATNVGTGAGVYKSLNATILELRKLKSGTLINTTQNTDDISFDFDTTLLNAFAIYVDSAGGDDTTGTGHILAPFQTVHQAITLCTSTTDRYVLYLAPGTYGGADITNFPATISIIGNNASIQFDITLDVPAGEDVQPLYSGVSLQSITMDLTPAGVAIPIFMNAGFNITRIDATTGAHLFKVFDGSITDCSVKGNALMNNVLFLGSATVEDTGQLLLSNCIVGINIDVIGTGTVSMVGCTFPGSITGTVYLSNTPTVRSDASSMGFGGTITGCNFSYSDTAQYVGYTPSTPSNWSTVPAKVSDALDELASNSALKFENIEWEFARSVSQNQYYKKLNYTLGDLTSVQIYTDNTMTTLQYTKTLTYTLGDLTSVVITRASDSATATKTLTYTLGNLTSVDYS